MKLSLSSRFVIVLTFIFMSVGAFAEQYFVSNGVTYVYYTNSADEPTSLWVKSGEWIGLVEIPESFTKIINGKKYVLPVTEIGQEAFKGKDIVKIIAKSVKKIKASAFEDCKKLETVVFSDNLEQIDTKAFKGCTALKSFESTAGLKYIYDEAFYGCTALSDFKFQEGLLSVWDNAFNSTAIPNLRMPSTLSGLGVGAFRNSALEWVEFNSKLTSISDYCFALCKSLKNVTFKNQISLIGDHSFRGCAIIGDLVLPASITKIGAGAFYENAGITSVYLKGTKTLGDFAFTRCTELKNVREARMLNTIGHAAFLGCVSLKGVEWTDELVTIKSCAFKQAFDFASLEFPESVREVADSAFLNSRLVDISFAGYPRTIGDRAFYNSTLNSVAFSAMNAPSYKTTLNYESFFNCTSLKKIDFGSGLIDIGDFAFYNCTKLSGIEWAKTKELYVGRFSFGNCKFTSFYIPSSIRQLEPTMFSATDEKASLIYPNKLLKEITIGEPGMKTSLKITGRSFDSFVYELEQIICWYPTPPFDGLGCYGRNTILYVPAGSKDAYVKKYGSYFSEVREMYNGGLNEINKDEITISVNKDGSLCVDGTDELEISIYSVGGRLIYRGDYSMARLEHKGIYILNIEGKSIKIVI